MEKFIKSPLNYTGGKYKLLPKIQPLFPKDIDCFVDVFGGGGNVAINQNNKYIVYNELQYDIYSIINLFREKDYDYICDGIKKYVEYFKLDDSKENFYLMRDYINSLNKVDPILLYTMLCYSFNNSLRKNSKNEYNQSSGFQKHYFTENMKKHLDIICKLLKDKNFLILNKDFEECVNSVLKSYKDFSKLFFYFDPPYLISDTNYNSNNGWVERDDERLFNVCDKLNNLGIKFAMSNVIIHKGTQNKNLIEWSNKYIIHNLKYSYGGSWASNKTREQIDSFTQEVLITNY